VRTRRRGPHAGRSILTRTEIRSATETPAADSPSPVLEVSRLSISFSAVDALSDVSFAVHPGELVTLTGEPGAGKTTVARCVAGDVAPSTGQVTLRGRPVPAEPVAARRMGISILWQDLALPDNLDVAGAVLLGSETRRLMFSEPRFHSAAAALLESLRIPIRDTTQLVGSLSGGQRQLIALAAAVGRRPELLVLDEPTVALGGIEAAQVEELVIRLRNQGTAVLMITRDSEQMFRMANRILVLRHGRLAGELDPRVSHPDDLAALQSGQEIGSSARRQLTRLHGLADRLISADPASSLSLILSALGSALSVERICIHVVSGQSLVCEAALGFAPEEIAGWSRLPLGAAGGPVGRAALHGQRVVEADLRGGDADRPTFGELSASGVIVSAWSVPVLGPSGVGAVITVLRSVPGAPDRDDLDLLALYAGYAAAAVERDRLLHQVTARNRILETTGEMLETLAGPITVEEGLGVALQSLRHGLEADEVALVTGPDPDEPRWRAYAGPSGPDQASISPALREAASQGLGSGRRDGVAQEIGDGSGGLILAVAFNAPSGPTALVATWDALVVTDEETALIETAAHSLRLALEREEAGLAHQEAAALRRARELQRGFLSRLSHELRTPLTAIRGYASSLMQTDVTWDADSQRRFLGRIAAESARLGRLVDDLLDFSAIESGVMRLQPDWCDLRLVVEAAVSCLPAARASLVSVSCDPGLPSIWGDHDRLEQVFLNLLSNAFRHNPDGTRVSVSARELPAAPLDAAARLHGAWTGAAEVEITVVDDGPGFPDALARSPFEPTRHHRSRTSGAGLGLSITRGIVEAHAGRIDLAPVPVGTAFRICLPVEAAGTQGTSGNPLEAASV
jgi:signal transduction histidine kinase/ABC-type multidrug transport system ATPase subunit